MKYWRSIKNSQKYAGKELFIGSVTDPYNSQEETYGRTRALLEQMQGSGAKISIATKSDLILRDLDLIKSFPDARVSLSINTLNETFCEDMDKAVSIQRRLAAIEVFHKAGVRTTCFISPIFPGITDVKEIIRRAKAQCNLIWLENLNLRGGYKTVIMDYIQRKHPDLLPLYQEIYGNNDRRYWELLDGGDYFVLHLRMTGCLLLTPADYPAEKHTHIVFHLSSGDELRFSDTRRFGRFWLFRKGESDTYSGMDKLGLEPFDDGLTADYLQQHFGKTPCRCYPGAAGHRHPADGGGPTYHRKLKTADPMAWVGRMIINLAIK